MIQEAVSVTIEKIRKSKLAGDAEYKAGDMTAALKAYYDGYLALRMLVPAEKDSQMAMFTAKNRPQLSPAEAEEADKLRRGVLGNMSMVYIKQEKWERVVKMSQDILSAASAQAPNMEPEPVASSYENADPRIPENIKPMYRLALGKFRLGDVSSAQQWLQKVLAVEPNNDSVGAI